MKNYIFFPFMTLLLLFSCKSIPTDLSSKASEHSSSGETDTQKWNFLSPKTKVYPSKENVMSATTTSGEDYISLSIGFTTWERGISFKRPGIRFQAKHSNKPTVEIYENTKIVATAKRSKDQDKTVWTNTESMYSKSSKNESWELYKFIKSTLIVEEDKLELEELVKENWGNDIREETTKLKFIK
jgi:hypothetical protein